MESTGSSPERLLQGVRSATPTDWCPVSSTVVDAHQHAAGNQKRAQRPGARPLSGGSTAKLSGFRYAGPLPLLAIAGRNTHGCMQFTAVMEARGALGRDWRAKGCILRSRSDLNATPRHPAHVPKRADQIRNRLRRGGEGGRPPRFDEGVDSYEQPPLSLRPRCGRDA